MKLLRILLLMSLITGYQGLIFAAEDSDKIDINSADVHILQTLNGIGEKKAQAIIDYRNQYGPFNNIHDLLLVYGIGEKILEANQHRLVAIVPESKTADQTEAKPAANADSPVKPESEDSANEAVQADEGEETTASE